MRCPMLGASVARAASVTTLRRPATFLFPPRGHASPRPYGGPHASPSPHPGARPRRPLAARRAHARRLDLAGLWRGDHAVSLRRRPVRGGSAPRDRHRGARRRAGGRGRVGRSPLRRDGRLLGTHDQHPNRRRPLRHLLPAPVVSVGGRGRAGGGRPARGSGGEERGARRRAAPSPLRRPRRRHGARLPRPTRVPAAGRRCAERSARSTGTARSAGDGGPR